MCRSIFLLFLLSSLQLCAQNLIPNPGFELYKKCPKGLGQLDRCNDWTSPNTGSPDFFSQCYVKDAHTIGVPNNYFGTRQAYEGRCYAGILNGDQEKEYLQIELLEPLVAGRSYCLRFRTAVPVPEAEGREAMGAILSKELTAEDNWNPIAADPKSLLKLSFAFQSTSVWEMVTANITAEGGERFLIIGYFLPSDHRAYTYLDGFELYESLSESGCNTADNAVAGSDPDNLVPNPGFELRYGCPKAREELTLASNWTIAENSPDFYHICGSGTASVPINELGQQNPHSGNGYGGIWAMLQERGDYREFVQTRLKTPLLAGQKYCLSIWVSLAEDSDFALDELQLQISMPDAYKSVAFKPDTSALVTLGNGRLLDDQDNWVFLHGTFVAKGGEQIIHIGNFRGNDDPHLHKVRDMPRKGIRFANCCYYYIDDIGLHRVGSPTCSCPADSGDEVAEAVPQPEPEPEIYKAGDTLVLRNLRFAYDKSEILPASFPQLDSLADYLLRQSHLKVRIVGHTDSDGDAAYNLRLSADRALAVSEYLKGKGIAMKRLQSNGKGESQPSASNDSPEGRALNRRVEIEFLED